MVQLFLDEYPDRFRFLLSGSSARKLRRGQANLLPGRIHVHQMHPLLACELAEDFDLDRALAHGTLPGIYAEQDSALRAADLRSYADTYLREEIQAEALVRNLGSGSSRSSVVGHPRLFLFDIGVRNALLRRPLDGVEVLPLAEFLEELPG